jgi:excisionase family DNA binding protein
MPVRHVLASCGLAILRSVTRRSTVADYEQLGFPELIDIDTLAKLLGVGERYVRRMVAERRVPTVRVGRLVRFDLAEIRRWIEEQRRPGARS